MIIIDHELDDDPSDFKLMNPPFFLDHKTLKE